MSIYLSQPGCFSSNRSARLQHCCMELFIPILHNLEISHSRSIGGRVCWGDCVQGTWGARRPCRGRGGRHDHRDFASDPLLASSGRATALIAVLGPVQVHRLGYVFVRTPVLTGSPILLLVAVIVNNISEHWW
jgi:hypothetical protein